MGVLMAKIEIDIEGNVILPFVWRTRLFIVCEIACTITLPLIVM